jgi:hypothetical protein
MLKEADRGHKRLKTAGSRQRTEKPESGRSRQKTERSELQEAGRGKQKMQRGLEIANRQQTEGLKM